MAPIVRYEPSAGAPSIKVSQDSPSSGIASLGEGIQQMVGGLQQAAYTMSLQNRKTNEEALHGTAKMTAARVIGELDSKIEEMNANARATQNVLDYEGAGRNLFKEHLNEARGQVLNDNPQWGERVWALAESAMANDLQVRYSNLAKQRTSFTAEFSKNAYNNQTKSTLAGVHGPLDAFQGSVEALDQEGQRMIQAGTLNYEDHEKNISTLITSSGEQLFERLKRDDPEHAMAVYGEFVERMLPISNAQTAAALEKARLINRDALEKEISRSVDLYNYRTHGGGDDKKAEEYFTSIGANLPDAMNKRREAYNNFRLDHKNKVADLKEQEKIISEGALHRFSTVVAGYLRGAGPDDALNYATLDKEKAKLYDLMDVEDRGKADAIHKEMVKSHGIKFDDTIAEFNLTDKINHDPFNPSTTIMVMRGQFKPETKAKLLDHINKVKVAMQDKDKSAIHEQILAGITQGDTLFELNPTEVASFSKMHMRNRLFKILLDGDKPNADPELKRDYESIRLNPTAFVQSFVQREAEQARQSTIRLGRDVLQKARQQGLFINNLSQLAIYSGSTGGFRFNTQTKDGQDEYKAAAVYLRSLVDNPQEQARNKAAQDEYQRKQQIQQEEELLLENFRKQRK